MAIVVAVAIIFSIGAWGVAWRVTWWFSVEVDLENTCLNSPWVAWWSSERKLCAPALCPFLEALAVELCPQCCGGYRLSGRNLVLRVPRRAMVAATS
jgi:hypothetical protein